ncbi:ubiquitin conjugating enzyme E2 for HECT-type and RBR family E3 Ub ligases, Ubc14 [Schizosaccharomyces pombe]|uniref:Ubiquitin-conjugating enzyme E2 14 n=1 Tax=Schizosaccharomyces pombe (strain 972 / ATCC 24843) TaxID=284812 RepID=UBC14_SCHPO|nr:putative ubiquitin conjugating enzyme Ubc14 [Schizosaccharomyces pombe]Q9UTN8.1 RecName: Full=Ubiquitin-conjugating enzyme E2 14; AltName: Full=E2 ubiquitin-conjugating enzyme 14; AltName: Full=Ubiquitin carrier protein 14; AltName: Full=Ubiquitin-protein ligase 14 [Schizosaccharomyces pombe 972h-]CAB54826.1 ubiquitin conjugating enzyme Ubc14 (predicted) [Schizosaccharomyces pombe]|eukprot:NP_594859.1 putative ubiquitin conjugating enzyme Ubc14 [Schizosaccharomyces pombe]
MASASPSSSRRLTKEYSDLREHPIPDIRVNLVDDNLFHWACTALGPSDSVYAGGKFHFSLKFPLDYPFQPPTIEFTTRIYHPNFDSEGNVCLAILKQQVFKPSIKLRSVLEQILQLLREPNPDDPLVASIAEQYRNDRPSFDKIARDYVEQFAKS